MFYHFYFSLFSPRLYSFPAFTACLINMLSLLRLRFSVSRNFVLHRSLHFLVSLFIFFILGT